MQHETLVLKHKIYQLNIVMFTSVNQIDEI